MKRLRMKEVKHQRRLERATQVFALSILLLLAVMFTACSSSKLEARDDNRGTAPQRIVSLTPSTTEILAGVGAFPRVVAVSDYCKYPPEVERLPRVGGWQNTNIERIAALRPDLVVFTDAQTPFVKDRFESLGIRTAAVKSRTLDDALAAITEIGRATGNTEQANGLLKETQRQLDEVRARTQNLSRPRVLCVVDRAPGTLRDVYAATKESFIAQLIEIAGGEVIAPSSRSGYGQISKEAILSFDPEIIIDMVQGAEAGGMLAEDSEAVWRELAEVRAVKANRVYPIADVSVLHPSQFVGTTARRFAELIHPEVFAR